MSIVCDTVLAFADDTCFICKDLLQLKASIKVIEDWCKLDDIELNKKKSGILILNDNGLNTLKSVSGIPVVDEYKYLGVLLDNNINPARHITLTSERVSAYFKRYGWLRKKYFSPSSLMTIIELFIKSRLTYGMCCFMGVERNLTRLDQSIMRHIVSILNLPKNISFKRLRIVLGEPEIHVRLSIRLLKVYHKYRRHFGEEASKFREQLYKYFTDIEIDSDEIDYNKKRDAMIHENLNKIISGYYDGKYKVRFGHRGFLKKYLYNHHNFGDQRIIRFFAGVTKATNARLFPKCICGMENEPGHALNVCEIALSTVERKKLVNRFSELYKEMGKKPMSNLHEYMLYSYFELEYRIEKLLTKVFKIIREVVFTVVTAMKPPEDMLETGVNSTE